MNFLFVNFWPGTDSGIEALEGVFSAISVQDSSVEEPAVGGKFWIQDSNFGILKC